MSRHRRVRALRHPAGTAPTPDAQVVLNLRRCASGFLACDRVRFDLRLPFVPRSPVVRFVFGKMFRDATAGLVTYVSAASKAA